MQFITKHFKLIFIVCLTNIDTPDTQLLSPLHIASEKGNTAIVVALIEEGADVNVKGGDKGNTPLMLTVSHITNML